jgi:AraC-like DNA-binding protein
MDFWGDERLKKLFSPPYIINIANDKAVKRMFGHLDYYFENFTLEDFKEAAFHTLNEILICLSYRDKNEIDVTLARESDPMVMRMTAFIDENIESELNASVLASYLNFSESYVQNRFLKVMGIGLKQYINRKKIYAARADIIGGMSPNSAAQKYCFADYSSFFRHYKKILGISPKDDKKQER